jgi:D-alanyl-D-alanine carboxypeptidase
MFVRPRRVVSFALAASALAALALGPSAAAAHGRHHAHARGHARFSAAAPITGGEPKYTAVVMDARSGEILYDERADSPRYPASVTKVMTMYLAFEAMAQGRLHLTDQIVVSPLAASQPATKLGLRAGETISVEDALHAMAVHSANDMAVAVSEKVGGTEARFAEMMTLKAQQLGMTHSHFVNANGLPDNRQISSAHDLAILARAVLRDYPQYYGFFSQEQFTYRGRTMYNTNHLLGKVPGVDGLKTGFTNAAGFNLAASAVRNGHRLIAVVMGSSSGSVRNANVEGLLLKGFDFEDRRDHGEKMLASQTFFERGPGAVAAARGLVGRDTDSDPIDVVLTRSTARPAALTVSATMPKAAAANSGRTWSVQVGQFHSRQAAKVQVATVSQRFASHLNNAEGYVDGRSHAFHARFSGLTEAAAKDTCSAIRARGLTCVASDRS